MECLISILVPVYNTEKYVKNCINSIRNQSYKNIEIIIVDDGSTDESGNICEALLKEDTRIHLIRKKNGGVSDARNVAIKNATGAYFMFVDSDDYISEKCIEILYSNIKKNKASIAICQMIRTTNLNETSEESSFNAEVYSNEQALSEMFYGKKFCTSPWAKLYSIDLFENIEFPLGKIYEDLFTIYKVFHKSEKIVYCSFVGYFYYYRSEGSIVVSNYRREHLEAFEALNIIKQDINICDDLRSAFASQALTVIGDFLSRNPKWIEIKNLGVWCTLKENRMLVLKDKYAIKRLRMISLISYLGPIITIKIIYFYYQMKWKLN